MTRRRLLLLLLASPVSLVAFAVVLLVTGFLACGISGCSGGGFGPAYAPVQAQVGLVVAGLTLAPLPLLALRGGPRRWQAAGAVAAALAGAVVGMLLLGLSANGCPQGQSRAVQGPGGFSPGSATCSGDRDAVVRG